MIKILLERIHVDTLIAQLININQACSLCIEHILGARGWNTVGFKSLRVGFKLDWILEYAMVNRIIKECL